MSASTKKGGTIGLGPKSERSEGMNSTTPSKGDSLTTTPSKSTKHGGMKKSGTKGNENPVNPAILNQQALESLYSATYVEDFIDCNDNMSDDLIRQTTRMFEMGSNYMTYIRELESAMAILLGDEDEIIPDQLNSEKRKAVFRLQQVLMTAQDTGDDSLQVMQSIQDHIENKTRQLDVDRKNLSEFCKEQDIAESTFKDPPPPPTERNIKRARRNRHEIYRPSILGPSSLKATSYPETVSNSSRDPDSHHVVTSSRSRDRSERAERDRDRESHREREPKETSSSSRGGGGDASGSSSEEKTEKEEHHPKPNGRTSERSSGSSLRNSITSGSTQEQNSTREEKRDRESSNSGYSSTSNKKHSHKIQQQQQEVKKTKKRKAKQSNSNSKDDNSPQQYAIDPDEPTYCLCDQVSYGEMIGCDNDLCPIEWFHFSCVSLTTKPKGKWYCPKCRGDRPNIMKPKAIFLKELEKYNREKEEKA